MVEYVLYGVQEDDVKIILRIDNSLKKIDDFTMCFYNHSDFVMMLNELYMTTVKLKNIFLVKKDSVKEMSLPIRYKKDMYDEFYVIERYKNYLWLNPYLLKYSNLKHVNLDAMKNFKETGNFYMSEREFDMAVHAYFYKENKVVYTKVREAYFELLGLGQEVKCKKK